MDLLVKALEAGQFREVILNESYHANDFASVLKQYFSELPEPLLIKRHLNAYLQAAGKLQRFTANGDRISYVLFIQVCRRPSPHCAVFSC